MHRCCRAENRIDFPFAFSWSFLSLPSLPGMDSHIQGLKATSSSLQWNHSEEDGYSFTVPYRTPFRTAIIGLVPNSTRIIAWPLLKTDPFPTLPKSGHVVWPSTPVTRTLVGSDVGRPISVPENPVFRSWVPSAALPKVLLSEYLTTATRKKLRLQSGK